MRNLKVALAAACAVVGWVFAASADCRVALDGRTLPVHPARVSARPINQVWAGYQRPVSQTEMATFVSFDLASCGELNVWPDEGYAQGEPIVLPLSFRPAIRREGGAWTIRVDRPRQFAVSFGKDAPVLHVFANPPFVAPKGGKIRRFGPGEHDVGLVSVGSDETVVIEEGAVVYGAIQVLNATNAKIVGRGIVDASRLNRADHASAAYRSALAAGLTPGFYGAEMAVTAFTAVGSTNVLVEGVTFRDPPRWTMIVRAQCRGVTIDNVKVIGCWRYNSDGINVCSSEDVTIRNSFVRSFDDCIVARGSYLDGCTGPTRNVLAENCVLWCDWGKNLEVWAGHKPCLIENVTFRNIACVYPGQTACDVTTWFASPDTTIRGVTMEDIEFDYARTRWTYHYQNGPDDAAYRGRPVRSSTLFQVDVASYGRYLGNQKHEPAKDLSPFRVAYSNLTFRNFRCLGDVPELNAVIDATTAPHTVEGVTLENLPKKLRLKSAGLSALRP